MSSIPDDANNVMANSGRQEITSPQVPKNKVQSVLQELEIMALQKGGRNSLGLSKFSKDQIDKLLETISENEKNAFAFHTKRIDAINEIELKKIDASVINQRTIKVVLIGGLLFIVPLITLLILFFKETCFIPWLSFLTGILGGFGLSKIASKIFSPPEVKNPIKEEETE